MKIYIINHRCNDDEIEAKNGIHKLTFDMIVKDIFRP